MALKIKKTDVDLRNECLAGLGKLFVKSKRSSISKIEVMDSAKAFDLYKGRALDQDNNSLKDFSGYGDLAIIHTKGSDCVNVVRINGDSYLGALDDIVNGYVLKHD